MPSRDFRNLAVHYEVWGSGLSLVLLHAGGGSSSAQWQRIAAILADEHRSIAPDLLGFGRTAAWHGPGNLTHDLQAKMVASLIAGEIAGPVDVVGHSYGGATALRLALNRPDLVRTLVLIEPILTPLLRGVDDALFEEYRRVAEGFIAHAQAGSREAGWTLFFEYRNGPGAWGNTSDKARARFLAQTEQTVDGFRSNLSNPTTLDDCRNIRIPTTIVCGGETTLPDKRVTELLRDAIPSGEYVMIDGAGHMSPLTHPEAVAAIVREHLAGRHRQGG
jgi:pimeloyl-ACP methyl ester carboxylesterase